MELFKFICATQACQNGDLLCPTFGHFCLYRRSEMSSKFRRPCPHVANCAGFPNPASTSEILRVKKKQLQYERNSPLLDQRLKTTQIHDNHCASETRPVYVFAFVLEWCSLVLAGWGNQSSWWYECTVRSSSTSFRAEITTKLSSKRRAQWICILTNLRGKEGFEQFHQNSHVL